MDNGKPILSVPIIIYYTTKELTFFMGYIALIGGGWNGTRIYYGSQT